ncbi:TPA: Mbeg1-like protein [Campylobacter jejuni]
MQEKINELKDYAELAQASYFYFDLEDCILQENETIITLNELLNLSYNGKIAGKKEKVGQKYSFISKGELNGEFGELQTKNFIQRYEVQFHQPNTTSGFSATLFYDKQKDEFIVGFRGTEGFWNIDTMQDITLSLNGNIQSSSLLEFLEQVNKIIKNKHKRIIFVGHSLGGYLAQMALIYCDIKYKDKLSFSPNEVYTFNAPSVYGWNFPNIAINPNTIKIMQDLLGKYTIDVSEKITHFEYFLSLIATIMQETNGILEELGDNYYASYKAPTISQTKIIDFILKAQEKEKYILILDKNDFNKYRKDCSFINNQENLAHKIAIGEFRIFIVVYKDMKCLENINNITKIYGYNSKSYKIKDQIWDEQYLGGVCKISQALYFNGKAKIGII